MSASVLVLFRLMSPDFSRLCVAGAGAAGARRQCAHLLFPAGAAVLRQHLLCGVGLQTGDPRGRCICPQSLPDPHHPERDQRDAETSVVQGQNQHIAVDILYACTLLMVNTMLLWHE